MRDIEIDWVVNLVIGHMGLSVIGRRQQPCDSRYQGEIVYFETPVTRVEWLIRYILLKLLRTTMQRLYIWQRHK